MIRPTALLAALWIFLALMVCLEAKAQPQPIPPLTVIPRGDASGRDVSGVAGTSFRLDGRGGYLVLPAFEGRPQGTSIEIWFKSADDVHDCAPLLSVEGWHAFELDACHTLELHLPGQVRAHHANTVLGSAWHHAAVVIDDDGHHTVYLDGLIDSAPDWNPEHEVRQQANESKKPVTPPPPLQLPSGSTLRVGATATGHRVTFQGYVSGLKVWSVERDKEDVRKDAFAATAGSTTGLLGHWPLGQNLKSVSGGGWATLYGGGSLARLAPRVSAFRSDQVASAPVKAATPAYPATPSNLPVFHATPKMVGACRRDYVDGVPVSLSDDHNVFAILGVDQSDFVACTTAIFGSAQDRSNAVFRLASATGKTVSVQIMPDGRIEIPSALGTLEGTGIQAKTFAADRLVGQEDIDPIESPWWSSQVRIPLRLIDAKLGEKIRVAIDIHQVASAKDADEVKKFGALDAVWPKAADPTRADTWANLEVGGAARQLAARKVDPGTSQLLRDRMKSPAPNGATAATRCDDPGI